MKEGATGSFEQCYNCQAAVDEKARLIVAATVTQQPNDKERMARKLRTLKCRCNYALPKQIMEPVFGQTKEVRGFRRFLLRGLENVQAEWSLMCLTHNLLKLFRSGLAPKLA